VIGRGAGKPLILYFSIPIAVIFPFLLVVIGVAQNVPNENLLAPIIDPGNQTALVVADVENDAQSSDRLLQLPCGPGWLCGLLDSRYGKPSNLHLVDFDRSHRLSHRLEAGGIHTGALKMAIGILLQELDSQETAA